MKAYWRISLVLIGALVLFFVVLGISALAKTGKFGGFGGGFAIAQPYTVVQPTGGTAATTSRTIGTWSPQFNNQFDLGEPTFSWRNIYASGTLAALTLSSTNLTWTNATGTNTTSTNLSVTNASTSKLVVDTTSTASTFVATKLGTAAQASYSFAGNPDTGLFEVSAGRLGIASGGSSPMSWTSQTILAGDVIVNSTNAYDLGSVTAGFKNIYVSSTIFGVNSTMTGTSTAGPYLLADDAGMVTGMDMTITSAFANGGDAGYQFNLNNDPYLDIYGRYDSGVVEPTSTAIRFYHNLLGVGGIDIGTGTGMGAGGFVNVYASGTLALGGMSVTSTFDSITSTTTKGTCLALQDVAGGTRTYCTAQGGTLTCGTTSCK